MAQLREKYGGKKGGDATNTGGHEPNVSGRVPSINPVPVLTFVTTRSLCTVRLVRPRLEPVRAVKGGADAGTLPVSVA
jgi:hypothetical protein